MSDVLLRSTLELPIQRSEIVCPPQPLAVPCSDSLLTSQSEVPDVQALCTHRPFCVRAKHVSAFNSSGRHFTLRTPISVQECLGDDVWVFQYAPLGIVAYAPSREEAEDAFYAEFACCWDDIAREEDSRLSADARDLKRKLRGIIANVE